MSGTRRSTEGYYDKMVGYAQNINSKLENMSTTDGISICGGWILPRKEIQQTN